MISSICLLYSIMKPITIIIDGEEKKFITYQGSIEKVLNSKKIVLDLKDKIEPALESKVKRNTQIFIKRAVALTLTIEGEEKTIRSAEDNIDSMLKAEGIILNPDDKLSPEKEAKLHEGMNVEIIRVQVKTLTESLPINFKTTVKNNSSLPNTERKVTQEGKNGEKVINLSVTYENGKEVSRKIVSETIVKEPVDKIILQGTYPLAPVSRGGEPLAYSRVFKAKATAYYAVYGVGKTYTASGRKAVRDTNGYSTIAVDPRVIPYGTKVFVEGYGLAIAADTGTGIVGNTIDVFFNTYNEACNWAVKYVNVYILK